MHLSGLTSGCHSQRDAINLIRSRASVEVGVRLEEQQVRYAYLHKNHKVFSLSSCYKNRCGPAIVRHHLCPVVMAKALFQEKKKKVFEIREIRQN